jgi:hypothetical protein
LASTANPLQANRIGTFTQVPPDLKHFDFGQVACPAVSGRFRKLQLWVEVRGSKMQRQFLYGCEIVVGYLFAAPSNN